MQDLKIGEPVCVAATGDFCGEGVLWHRDSQSVYWTDINRFLAHRYSLRDRTTKTWFLQEPVTCVMETSPQRHPCALTWLRHCTVETRQ